MASRIARRFGRHIAANLVAYLALFMAMGGTAYAANEWTGDNIVDGTLTGADIATKSLSGADIRNKSVKGVDIADNTVTGVQVDESTLGQVPSAATATVAGNADSLDGLDSTNIVQGAGKVTGQALAVTPGANTFLGPPLNGFLRLSYFCPNPTSNTGFLWVYNDSGSVANVFSESGDANPSYRSMAAGANFFMPASAAGDSWRIQAQGAPGILTIDVATVNRPSDCHAQAQALLTNS